MNKVLVCLLATLAGAGAALPAAAQDVAALDQAPVVIAPAKSDLAQTIKDGLSAAYAGATEGTAAHSEAQKLYFFYGERYFEPIWLDQGTDGKVSFSATAEKILALFKSANAEGLRPADYLTPDLDPAAAVGNPAAFAELETAFSRATMRYARHIYSGRLDPRSVDTNLDLPPKQLDEASLLIELASANDPVAVIAKLQPTHPEFLALKAALASFGAGAEPKATLIAGGPTLKPGMSDPRVPAIRQRLELPAAGESTLYDDSLAQAMMTFQAEAELHVDGVLGPATLAALNGGQPVTREEIIANMERWRWMPRDMGDFHVLVNIPEFRLSINRGNTEEYTTRVVVGTPENSTPIFSDSIRHVVVNPYWNVPSSITNGEIAPQVLANPSYLDANNYDLIYQGDVVSPWQVNWYAVGDSFPFKVRQRPGPGNALGQIKFLFPNKHDVYLHDTPSKALFARDVRAFSHGCVRVENPMEFADALMANEPNINRASLEAMFGPSERWVNPEQRIPVHLAYFTVRPQDDGSLKGFGDIYGHNAKVIEALGLRAPPLDPAIVAAVESVQQAPAP
ncbi:L,D-transpeptidase family protein [Devosia sp. RR2S18]|uniref:L,D-transpeptidase family protein n=1 Tax=Devosia rhizosphaerae TaxID=3049774 RepID=UPI0025404D61|nr:L,D-transpeptidase family protein [Devosia sp. RR2S18]WIJ26012.1 L,D-transpeptidase family protein [Devosia sp. RR2S18]